MRATEVLKLEHQVIVQVLGCLDRMTENPKDLDREAASEVVEFLADYADRRHHGKEEDLLFKAMAECGMPTDMGPIGVMLAEHVTGREAIASMRLALALETSDGNERFAVKAMEYVVLLHEHIQKEDHILYPMADSVFDEEVEARLAKAFAELEVQPGEEQALARNLELVERLTERFGVVRDGEAKVPSFEGCCHPREQGGTQACG